MWRRKELKNHLTPPRMDESSLKPPWLGEVTFQCFWGWCPFCNILQMDIYTSIHHACQNFPLGWAYGSNMELYLRWSLCLLLMLVFDGINILLSDFFSFLKAQQSLFCVEKSLSPAERWQIIFGKIVWQAMEEQWDWNISGFMSFGLLSTLNGQWEEKLNFISKMC